MVPPLSRLRDIKHRTVVLPSKRVRHMQSVIGVDADQMGVERRVMDFGKRNAVRNHRLAELFVFVRNDVSRIENNGSGRPDNAQRPL